jgi:uncharacterized YigZ family protein
VTGLFTVEASSEGLYKEKGSKFMAYLFPVDNEDDVRQKLEELKGEHKKARHFCYAFRMGADGSFERANDAGEPNGSAGLPILNQLHSANLTNALLVVVRYFGGTKLGLSGLVTAYKEAARYAIEMAKLKNFVLRVTLHLEFNISELGNVERFINTEGLQILEKQFDQRCVFRISCSESEVEKLMEKLKSLRLNII